MFSSRVRFWLVALLLVANLGVGILSLFFLRSVNQRYAILFERGIPVMSSLRTLTRELGIVQRLARRVADPDHEPAWKELPSQMEEGGMSARVHALDISTADLFEGTPHAAAIAGAGRDYDAKLEHFLGLISAGKVREASQYNNDILRPTYDNYLQTIDAAALHVESQSNKVRERYTQDSRFFGGLLLAFAGWPVIAAAVAVFVLAILIVTLLVTMFAPELGWSKRGPGNPSPLK